METVSILFGYSFQLIWKLSLDWYPNHMETVSILEICFQISWILVSIMDTSCGYPFWIRPLGICCVPPQDSVPEAHNNLMSHFASLEKGINERNVQCSVNNEVSYPYYLPSTCNVSVNIQHFGIARHMFVGTQKWLVN